MSVLCYIVCANAIGELYCVYHGPAIGGCFVLYCVHHWWVFHCFLVLRWRHPRRLAHLLTIGEIGTVLYLFSVENFIKMCQLTKLWRSVVVIIVIIVIVSTGCTVIGNCIVHVFLIKTLILIARKIGITLIGSGCAPPLKWMFSEWSLSVPRVWSGRA